MGRQEDLKKKYDQLMTYIALHPRGSLTGGVGTGGMLLNLIVSHGNPLNFSTGLALTLAAAGVTWKNSKDMKTVPVAMQGNTVLSTPPIEHIDMQKSERTLFERFKRAFDSNANGPYDPVKGVAKDEPFDDEIIPVYPPIPQKEKAKPVFTVSPDDETLRLGTVTANGARFDPHIDQLFGQGMIASAVQGSGKSMLNGVIIEQAGKCGVPVVVFDHKGEYAPITELPFINGLRAGSAKLRSKIGPDCFELTENNAAEFVQLVMTPDENGYRQAVIHLPSYGDGWLDRAAIVAAVGQALMARAVWLREQGIHPIPCLVLMDEAQLYLPQHVDLLPPEAREDKEVLNKLSNAYFALVSNGRSNGYTVLFATPSLTYIAKWAIKSCQIRVLMRHAEKNDLDMCEKIVGRTATREEIEALPKGTGVVFGFTDRPMIVKFDKKQSKDESETPGLDRLRKGKQPKQQQLVLEDLPQKIETMPNSKTTLNLDSILALAGKVSDETLLKLIDRLPDANRDEQEEPVIMMVDEPNLPKLHESTLLERGLKAYEEGFTTIDDLAARLAITPWEARNLRSQIKVALKQEDLCE